MKPISDLKQQPRWKDWRWQLENRIRSLDQLAECLDMPADQVENLRPVAERYPVLTTPYYLSLARQPRPSDPIVAQIVPDRAEMARGSAEHPDPLAEERDSPRPGLVHRYPDRVLVVTTPRCAVHCRHCMRKRAWDRDRPPTDSADRNEVVNYLQAHTEVREVILSGGDPLLLGTRELELWLAAVHALPHVDIVRLGSRLPIVLPQRFTPDFCALLGRYGPVWLATHANHPYELTADSAAAVRALLREGIPVVNQTVLLKGVNDNARVQIDLARRLLTQRIKPYYLFHADPVAGTRHFRTGIERALAIVNELRSAISGLAQPAFAFDLPGGGGKVRMEPPRECSPAADGSRCFVDFNGIERPYPEPTQEA